MLEKIQDLRLRIHDRIFNVVAIIVLEQRSSEYFIRVQNGRILLDKLLTLAYDYQWPDSNWSSGKSFSECFIFRAFTSHILFNGKIQVFSWGLFKEKVRENTFWHSVKKTLAILQGGQNNDMSEKWSWILPRVFPDKLPNIDFTDEAVVQCGDSAVKILYRWW